MNPKINQIVCIDFETGGLDRKNENHAQLVPVTQVGMKSFRADTFETISEFKTYVQPYADLEYQEEALKFTGVTMDMIYGGIPVKDMVKRMCEEFEKATTGNKRFHKPILLGHNIMFDIQFLQFAFAFCKVDLSKFLHGTKDAFGNFYPAFYDTMWMARQHFVHEEMTNYKLETVCGKLGVELIDAHEAMADVNATAEAYQKMTLKSRESEGGGSTSGPQVEKVKFRHTFQF